MAKAKPVSAAWRSRIVGHADVAPGELIAHPGNWRTHPKQQREALAQLLDEVGWVQDVIVNTTTGRLVDGHLRLELALERDEASLPVVYVELTEDEERRILATLDPVAAMAETNADAFAGLIDGMTLGDDALSALLAQVGGIKPQGRTDPDEVPPAPEPVAVYVERGQMWRLGGHRLMCGDATSAEDVARLTSGQSVDVVFTSPPYALGNSPSFKSNPTRRSAYLVSEVLGPDWAGLMQGWFDEARKISPNIIVNLQLLAGNKFEMLRWVAGRADALVDIVTWDKARSQPAMAAGVLNSQFEWLVIFGPVGSSRRVPFATWRGTVSNVYTAAGQRSNEFASIHAATFPVHLPDWVMATLCDGAVSYYEPFSGTGTTIIAAERQGRRCYAMEIEPRYVQVSIERWQNYTGEKAVLDGSA